VARSSTHSIRRSNNGLADQVRSRLPPGTVSSRVANRVDPPPDAFDAPLPPRHLAFEESEVFAHTPKLDSSTPHFIQSRTLERGLGTTAHFARAAPSTIAAPIAMSRIPLPTIIRCRVVIGHARARASRAFEHLLILSLRQGGKGGRRLIRKIGDFRGVALSQYWNKLGCRGRHVRGKPKIWVNSRLGETEE
jgi:hypothetical protein